MYLQPQCNDTEGWCRLCFGRLQPPGVTPEEVRSEVTMEGQDSDHLKHEGVAPLFSMVASLDQVRIHNVFGLSD